MAAAQKQRVFDPVGTVAPSAGAPPEATPETKSKATPRGREAKASRGHEAARQKGHEAKASEKRLSYSWRITRAQNDQLDRLATAVRDEAGRMRLDRSELLAALVNYASERPDVIAELAQHIETEP